MSEWISVSDRLPEVASRVSNPFIVDAPLHRTKAVLVSDGKKVWIGRLEWFDEGKILAGITHWQPKPEPPSAEPHSHLRTADR